jgi:hypothetical protein
LVTAVLEMFDEQALRPLDRDRGPVSEAAHRPVQLSQAGDVMGYPQLGLVGDPIGLKGTRRRLGP